MKLFLNRTLTAVAMVSTALLTGCLKDKDYDNGLIQSVHSTGAVPKVIGVNLTTTQTSNFFVDVFTNSDVDTTVQLIPVTLATADPAPADIHVTLTADQSIVDAYNEANGTAYEDPGSLYTLLDNGVVTIPKGQHTGYLKIKFKPSDFLGGTWAVGYQISNIQESGYTISGNLSTGIVALVIKNDYDGVYHAVGHFDHPSLAGDYDTEWTFATLGQYTNEFQLITTAIFGVFIDVTIDPNTNLLTITSQEVTIDPYVAANNYYDPSTRTYHFDFGYTTSAPRHILGTAVYEHP